MIRYVTKLCTISQSRTDLLEGEDEPYNTVQCFLFTCIMIFISLCDP